ncbi:Integrase catalytic core, partial [Macrophomina phaseolina MS6]
IFRHKINVYDRRQKALAELTTYIQESISTTNLSFITSEEPHPWNILRALQKRLAPTDQARLLELEHQYHQLCKPPRSQNVESWLQQWEKLYTEAKKHNLAEVSDNRPTRDFLLALKPIEPQFVSTYQIKNLDPATRVTDLYDMIEKFRQYYRENQSVKSQKTEGTHSAFPANFRGKQAKIAPPCPCGMHHWASECWYLNPQAEGRPKNFKPNPETQAKVQEKLQDPKFKEIITKALERNKQIQQRKQQKEQAQSENQNQQTSQSQDGQLMAMTAHYFSFAAQSSPLFNSWILDSGTDVHVCNQSMAHRFKETKKARPDETLGSGNRSIPIQAWGTVDITVKTETGQGTITLNNVAFIPSFMSNLVSMSIALSKKIYWDTQNMQLIHQGKHYCKVQQHQGHFLLEHNSNSEYQGHMALPAVTRKASAEKWHQILAHANPEVIQHLEANTEGVSVTNEPPAPKTTQCQPCALSKSQRIISRESTKEEDSDESFHRVSFDLLQIQKGYNQDKWTSHFACVKTDFTFIFTHPNKSDVQDIIEFVVKFVKTRYKRQIVFFRTDGERTIGTETKSFLQSEGITLETSAPATPEQNGHAERSGGVILPKARAMRIGANLPQSLWPEIVKTAGYIHNRTPMAKLNWKTPFEVVTGKRPNLSHLRIYGCRAYAHKKGIPRSQKLAEKAHFGYLVGYDSTNIFRIWIPSQHKVIRTRDVKFNEDEFYRPQDPDLTQLLQEEASEIIQTLEIQHPINQQTDEAESEDGDFEASHAIRATQDTRPEQEKSGRNQQLPSPDPSIAASQQHGQSQGLLLDLEVQPTRRLPRLLPAQYDTPPQPGAAPGNVAPRGAEISGTVTEDAIMPEGGESSKRSTRNPNPPLLEDSFKKPRKKRKDAYIAALDEIREIPNSSYFSAFSAAINSSGSSPRLHRDQLPPEPRTFKEMLQHPFSSGFIPALKTEVRDLVKIGTWRFVRRHVATQAGKKVIPLTCIPGHMVIYGYLGGRNHNHE